jgi:hypothetical protein
VKTTTQRSLAHLRADGYIAAVVEHWNQFAGIRQDLFGFADIIAFHPVRPGTLLVQTTVTGSINARIKKIQALETAKNWIHRPDRLLVVHGWSKRKIENRLRWALTQVWFDDGLMRL